jgi:hypothetical protein
MTGQIAGPSVFSLELVAFIVGVSMVVGAIDVIRQPGWAWKRAEESKAAYLILVLLLPLAGLAMYVLSARPKVATIAAAGRAASLPFERFGEETIQKQRQEQREDGWPIGTIAPPAEFATSGAPTTSGATTMTETAPITEDQVRMVETVTARTAPVEVSSTFFSSGSGGGTATKTAGPSITLARPYRPKQRASLTATDELAATVPAGWKADPTGRHQFRYWDGFQWTENVADAGEQSRDSVSS